MTVPVFNNSRIVAVAGVANIDDIVKSPYAAKALHPSSLRRTHKYASFLMIRAPCLWSFLLRRLHHDFLRIHQH